MTKERKPVRLRIKRNTRGKTSVRIGPGGDAVELVDDLLSLDVHASQKHGTVATIVAMVDLSGSDFEVERVMQAVDMTEGLTAEELDKALNDRSLGGATVTPGERIMRHLHRRGEGG